jgi:hypothetical protein
MHYTNLSENKAFNSWNCDFVAMAYMHHVGNAIVAEDNGHHENTLLTYLVVACEKSNTCQKVGRRILASSHATR